MQHDNGVATGSESRKQQPVLQRPMEFFRRMLGDVRIGERWPIVAMIAFFIMARVAGGTLPSLLFRVTLILYLASYLWTRAMMGNLECIYDSDEKELQRGQATRFLLRFDNEGFLPIPHLEAVSHVPGEVRRRGAEWKVATSVPGLGSRLLTTESSLEEHGRYRLGPVHVSMGDPFGWFKARKNLYGDRYVTVYPKVLPVRGGSGLPLRRPFGSLRTRIRSFADPSNLADIRPMQPGDNPRHIHWPTSARRGEPFVRKFELTASGEVHVMIDLSMSDGETGELGGTGSFETIEAREKGFDLAAGLAARCLRNGLSVGLVARGRRDRSLEPGRGAPRMRGILQTLAHSEVDCPISTDIVLEQVGHSLGTGSTLLLVTGTMTASLASRLSSLVQMGLGVGVFIINDGEAEGDEREDLEQGAVPLGNPFRVWTVPVQSSHVNLDEMSERQRHPSRHVF